jgi:hypothetical protein
VPISRTDRIALQDAPHIVALQCPHDANAHEKVVDWWGEEHRRHIATTMHPKRELRNAGHRLAESSGGGADGCDSSCHFLDNAGADAKHYFCRDTPFAREERTW